MEQLNRMEPNWKHVTYTAAAGFFFAGAVTTIAFRDYIFHTNEGKMPLDQLVAIVFVPLFGGVGSAGGAILSLVSQYAQEFFSNNERSKEETLKEMKQVTMI